MIHGLWTGYGILILDGMDYRPDLDKDLDPSGPSGRVILDLYLKVGGAGCPPHFEILWLALSATPPHLAKFTPMAEITWIKML